MKYGKCPRCELNYITSDEVVCKVCKDLTDRNAQEDETEFEVCPICYKGKIEADEIMCKKCCAKRYGNTIDI